MKKIKYDYYSDLIKEIKNRKRLKAAIGITIILIAVLFFGGYGESKRNSSGNLVIESDSTEENKEALTDFEDSSQGDTTRDEPREILCDISGGVTNPGVYTLMEGSRLEDLINAAGGLLDSADIDIINRARFLSDGEKVYIPEVGEMDKNMGLLNQSNMSQTSLGYNSFDGGKVNINTATSEELQMISGVGPVMAEKIIAYRNEVGGFKAIEELKNVSGIGEKTFEKMAESVTI